MLALVGIEMGGELVIAGRGVLDVHVTAELAVVVRARDALELGHRAPSESVHPAHRNHDERRQHIPHVVVGDRVRAVHLVHAPDRVSATAARNAMLDDGVKDQSRVGVALMRSTLEFAGFSEQLADARYGVGPIERESERLRHVPGKLMPSHDPVDLGELEIGIQLFDATLPVVALHGMLVSVAARVRPTYDRDPRRGSLQPVHATRHRARFVGKHHFRDDDFGRSRPAQASVVLFHRTGTVSQQRPAAVLSLLPHRDNDAARASSDRARTSCLCSGCNCSGRVGLPLVVRSGSELGASRDARISRRAAAPNLAWIAASGSRSELVHERPQFRACRVRANRPNP